MHSGSNIITGLLALYCSISFFDRPICRWMIWCRKAELNPQTFAHLLVQLLANNDKHIILSLKQITFNDSLQKVVLHMQIHVRSSHTHLNTLQKYIYIYLTLACCNIQQTSVTNSRPLVSEDPFWGPKTMKELYTIQSARFAADLDGRANTSDHLVK